MKIRTIDLPDDLDEGVFNVIKELRPHLELADFKHLVTLAHAADGYRLVVADYKGEVRGVMGYRILHDLVHGSHLYIDDLVTAAKHRDQGVGAQLLKFAEAEARRLGFTNLRLCTGIENEEAQRFYKREGWEARSFAFKKKVPSH
jgi:ribosomal protein S18 acetylase RimI-like enzyme